MNYTKNIGLILFDVTASAGTERAIVNLSNLLSEFGHSNYRIYIISIKTTKGDAYYKLDETVRIIHPGIDSTFSSIFSKIINYFQAIKSIRKNIILNKLDFILGTTHAINSLLPFCASFTSAIQIGCEHFPYQVTKWESKVLRRLLYPFLDKLVVLTEKDKLNYISFVKSIYVIPNVKPETNQVSNLKNKIVISVGRLTYQKGYDMLLLAWAGIKNLDGWKLRIFGEGEDENILRDQIKNLNIKNSVELKKNAKKIDFEYINASIYVMSSRFEGFPMVLVEASSYGLPLISFDCPNGPSDIIQNNQNGKLVENGNIQKLSEAINELISNKGIITEMGKKSHELSDRYSSYKIYNLWNQIFK